jgi:hypothetical protein
LEADKEIGYLWESEQKKLRNGISFFDRDGKKQSKYNFGKGKEYGRTFNSKSIGNYCSRVCSTICSARNEELKKQENFKYGLMDIDMVNSGYTIIYQMALKLKIQPSELKNIKLYIDNRDLQLSTVEHVFSVDKPLAKQLFITLSFGGTVNTWIKEYGVADIKTEKGTTKTLPILDGIIAEFIKIGKEFELQHPEIRPKLKKNTPDNYEGNKYGATLAEEYGEHENKCLDILLRECGYPEEFIPQHDGAKINMDEVYSITGLTPKEVMDAVNTSIELELDLKVKYDAKEFDSNPMPTKKVCQNLDNYLRFETARFNEYNTFEEKKRYFEIFHCKIKMPEVRYIYQKFDRLSSANSITPYTEDGLQKYGRNLFYNEVVLKGGKNSKVEVLEPAPFISRWIREENIREYDQFTFEPENKIMEGLGHWDGIQREHFNSFRGYSPKCLPPDGKQFNQKTKDKLLKHWYEVVFELCGGVQEQCDAYLDFLAHMIQKPNEKPPIAFIIKSVQGVGKNKTLEPIAKMLNDYFITSSNIEDFVGEHANGFVQKLLVNMNECQMNKNSFDQVGRIKSFITEDTISLNEKNEKRITVRNWARLLAFTQERAPFPIDFKTGNRRFQVFQATTKFAGMPDEFWAPRIKLWNSDEFVSILYDFLNTRDISNIKWKPIRTQGYIEMCAQFTPVEVLFLEDFFTQRYTEPMIASSLMYNYYTQFADRAGYKKDLIVTNPKLTNLLKDLDIGIEKRKIDGQSFLYLGDISELRNRLIIKGLIEPDDGEEITKAPEKEYEELDLTLEYEDDEEDTTTIDSNSSTSELTTESELEDNLSNADLENLEQIYPSPKVYYDGDNDLISQLLY